MTIPYVTAHTPDVNGMNRGTYSKIPECHLRNISDDHMAVQVEHSLFEGDRMTFYQILTSRDNELDRMRPIRFYTADETKIFDGVIIDTAYTYIGSDYMALRVNAAGWWQELSRMNFHQLVEYDGTWCADDIYTDLVRRANDMGVMKEAVYTYDTTKIPEYDTFSDLYDTPTGTTFTFGNVYEGMQILTQYLDIASSTCAYEFGLRIEALPRPNDESSAPIDESDVEEHIYILPFALNQDKAAVATYQKFQLSANYIVTRDYRQLANDVVAIGDGVVTQQIRTHPILSTTPICAAPLYDTFPCTHRMLTDHYLRVTITNPEATDRNGYVTIQWVINMANVDGVFPVHVPANTTQVFYTNERGQLSNCNTVLDKDLTSPPGSPADGDRYIVAIGATGDWSGHDNKYAMFNDSAWAFESPGEWVYCWVVDESGRYQWNPTLPQWVYTSANEPTTFRVDNLNDCTIKVEEVTNDNSPYNTTIAGKSVNDFGIATKTIEGMWLNTQARVDYAAGKYCQIHHAPSHKLYAPVLTRYVGFDNLIGNTANFYSPYEASLGGFLITDNVYEFKGKLVTQHLMGKQYSYDWDYDDTNIYVMVGVDNVKVGTDFVVM